MKFRKRSLIKQSIINLIIAVFLFIPYFASAQGIWTHYTDELPGVVYDMTQDKYSNYWFATTNGVCELDTNGFWHYLVDTTVWDTTMYFKNQIIVDRDNNKWFVGVAMSQATKEYVVKYDDSTFTYYNPSGKEKDTWISALGIDSLGRIWAGSHANWAYWFDGIQWHPLFVPGTTIYDGIIDFAVDRTGKLYIAHDNGISTINAYLWGDLYKTASSLNFDKENRLWFGTGGWGIGEYDGQNWILYTTNDGLLANFARVAIDSNYNIWVSYYDRAKGVSRFYNNQWSHFTKEDGLFDDYVGPIYVDRDGAIWFAHIIYTKAVSVFIDTTTTNVKDKTKRIVFSKTFILHQNFPNPFNSETTIHYELKQDKKVNLSIFNLKGEEVICLDSGNEVPGKYLVVWNGKDKFGKEVVSGIYFCVLKADSFIETNKIILTR